MSTHYKAEGIDSLMIQSHRDSLGLDRACKFQASLIHEIVNQQLS